MTLSATWNGSMELWGNNGIRPPMVPTYEDVSLMQRACPEGILASRKVQVLVLGVTPAIVMARWLGTCQIKAVDYDQDMIDALWNLDAGNRVEAVCADWSALPFPDDHFDLVLGDGSFCALPSLKHYPAVLAEIMRVKKHSAPIIARFFMRPKKRLTFHDLVTENGTLVLTKHEPSELNFLTMMAASNSDGTVEYNKAANKIQQEWGDLEKFLATAWPDEREAARFKKIMELRHCLNFPTGAQIAEQFSQFGLSTTPFVPSYRVGAYCPTIRFD